VRDRRLDPLSNPPNKEESFHLDDLEPVLAGREGRWTDSERERFPFEVEKRSSCKVILDPDGVEEREELVGNSLHEFRVLMREDELEVVEGEEREVESLQSRERQSQRSRVVGRLPICGGEGGEVDGECFGLRKREVGVDSGRVRRGDCKD